MTIAERIKALRALMKDNNYKAYIIDGGDPHASEYVAEKWESRKWISGFTGSAGLVIITENEACLWTDSRYFIQAEQEIKGTGIKLFKQGLADTPSYTKWLTTNLPIGSEIGFDGNCMTVSMLKKITNNISVSGITMDGSKDLIGVIWNNRPAVPKDKILIHDIDKSGLSVSDKLSTIRSNMRALDANIHFIGSLDDIAWTFNIRGSDISFNPLAISYALIGLDYANFYISDEKYTSASANILHSEGVRINDYDKIFEDLENIAMSSNVLLDPDRTNINIYDSIRSNIIEKENPSQLLKSIKNNTEISGFKTAMLKDGVAMENFLFWLDETLGKEIILESDIIRKLKYFRSQQEGFFSESFSTIAGYGPHGSLPHYTTSNESDTEVKKENYLLLDSGAHYLEGTTDITRTIPLGELSDQQKTDYTLVLKGMIQLSIAKFPKGTSGCNLDILARQALWFYGRDYAHGTGHGVGSFLNVHEGPQGIRQGLKKQAILAGMVTSNEPAIYRNGEYGIRHENIILCKESEKTIFGDFLEFETLTLCHFETKAILMDMLTSIEKEWLNNYHTKVYNSISPLLANKQKEWLRNKTKNI